MTQKPKQLPDLPPPQPATLLGETPTLDQLVQEVKNLRLYTGNLMLSVRAMRDYLQENFIAVGKRLTEHDKTLDDLLVALSDEETH